MDLISTAILLLFVMDPLGNVPVFLAILKDYSAKERTWIIFREACFALIILALFLFFGKYLLRALNITNDALSISGGVILFLIAIKMVFPSKDDNLQRAFKDPFIVPLAVPFFAGPSSLAVVMVMSETHAAHLWLCLGALFLAWLVATLIILSGQHLKKLLGRRGLTAMERLMGMVLTTIAVQMLMSGIKDYFF